MSNVSNNCKWCEGEISPTISMCSGCQILLTPFLGIYKNQIPTDDQRDSVNQLIEAGRGLSVQQRLLQIVNDVDVGTKLPPAFQSKRGPALDWAEASEQWAIARDSILKWGYTTGSLPLPGGGTLLIDEEKGFFLNGNRLGNELPLLDIAEWLSNPSRAGAIGDWTVFLQTLECLTRQTYAMGQEDWQQWFSINSYRGIDVPANGLEQIVLLNLHPFQEYIGKLFQIMEPEVPVGHRGNVSRENRNLMRMFGGSVGSEWLALLADKEEFHNSYHKRLLRLLVVHKKRLNFLVLKNNEPALIPLGNDPRIWRTFMAWSLEPPTGRGSEFANVLFWCWESENEEWLPSRRQIRSARLLHENIQKLDYSSSIAPYSHYYENNDSLSVVGNSGINYLIRSSESPNKFLVEAFPVSCPVKDAGYEGIDLCIDLNGDQTLPAGDIALGYLLALLNDTVSRYSIVTLDLFIEAMNSINTDIKDDSIVKWWHEVENKYEKIIDEWMENEQHEDLDDEEEYLDDSEVEEFGMVSEDTWNHLQARHDARIESLEIQMDEEVDRDFIEYRNQIQVNQGGRANE